MKQWKGSEMQKAIDAIIYGTYATVLFGAIFGAVEFPPWLDIVLTISAGSLCVLTALSWSRRTYK